MLSTTKIVKEMKSQRHRRIWFGWDFFRSSSPVPLLKWIGTDQVVQVLIWAGFEYL